LYRDGGGSNSNSNEVYYVGPYCSPDDFTSIYMGVFTTDGCATNRVEASTAEELLLQDYPEFGVPSLYLTTPMVDEAGPCRACVDTEATSDAGNGQEEPPQDVNGYRSSGVCERPYEGAARCEANMDTPNKDFAGCDYIRNVLPRLADAAASAASTSPPPSSTPGESRRSGGGVTGGRGQMMTMTAAGTTTKTKAKDRPSSSRRDRQSDRRT
jgi:hypothetical protein